MKSVEQIKPVHKKQLMTYLKLTNIHLGILAAEIEPLKNLVLKVNLDYRTLESASKTFSLDYYDEYELEPSSRPDCSNNDCIPGWVRQQGGGLYRNPADTPQTISYFVEAGLIVRLSF